MSKALLEPRDASFVVGSRRPQLFAFLADGRLSRSHFTVARPFGLYGPGFKLHFIQKYAWGALLELVEFLFSRRVDSFLPDWTGLPLAKDADQVFDPVRGLL
jgi:hypothetical protein